MKGDENWCRGSENEKARRFTMVTKAEVSELKYMCRCLCNASLSRTSVESVQERSNGGASLACERRGDSVCVC